MGQLLQRSTLALTLLCGAPATVRAETSPNPEPTDEAPLDPPAATPGEPAPETPPPVDESTTPAAEEPPPLYGAPAGGEAPPPPYEPRASDEDHEPSYEPTAGPFSRHRVRVGALVGFAGGATNEWLVLGAGVGYFVVDGLELHVDGTLWLIGSPFVATVSPGVRYVFHQLPQIKPYVGAFYQHYFVDRAGFDTDSVGGRLGIYFPLSERSYFGGGIVYERFLDGNLFRDRDQIYPEIVFAFAF